MRSIFNQPYPASEKSIQHTLLTGLLAGVFVALFIIVFQPFGTAALEIENKRLFLSGYGVIVAGIIWLTGLLSRFYFNDQRWTVGKQILFVGGGCLLGITTAYFYVLLLEGAPSWETYGVFLRNAGAVAIFPMVGMTLADYVIKLKRYSKGARTFNTHFKEVNTIASSPALLEPSLAPAEVPSLTMFAVMDDQGRPVTSLQASRIWCLRSDRNYVDVFHLDADGKPAKLTVRNTLMNVSAGLPEGFIGCHRSYFVRADGVESVTGNAQGYRLHCTEFPDCPVPVSRSRSAEVLRLIRH